MNWSGVVGRADLLTRSFVVGTLLPAIVAVSALSQLLTSRALPDWYSHLTQGAKVVAIVATALLVAIALAAAQQAIWRVLDGSLLLKRPVRPIGLLLINRARNTKDRLESEWSALSQGFRGREDPEGLTRRLRTLFPHRAHLAPTAFGNVIHALDTQVLFRWNLDVTLFWSRLELVLPDRAVDAYRDARTGVNAFVNSAILVALAGAAVLIDRSLNSSTAWYWYVVGGVAALLLIYGLYRGAVLAAIRLSTVTVAALDLYRMDVFRQLGARVPNSRDDEEMLARMVNAAMLYGEPLPDEARAGM